MNKLGSVEFIIKSKLILILIGFGLYFLITSFNKTMTIKTKTIATNAQEDWKIYDLQRWQLNPDTKQQYFIIAKEAVSTNKQKIIKFKQPDAWLILPKKTIHLLALKATQQKEQLILKGSVNISMYDNDGILTLNSEQVNYNYLKKELYSANFVEITQNRNTLQGEDMKLNIDTGKFRMLRKVKALYYP